MGNLQSSVNAALGTATKIEKLYKPLGQIEKQLDQLEPWQQQQVDEQAAIHQEQMERINKPGASAGEKVYVPEDLQSDPRAMGPMPFNPALFGEPNGFDLHSPFQKSGQLALPWNGVLYTPYQEKMKLPFVAQSLDPQKRQIAQQTGTEFSQQAQALDTWRQKHFNQRAMAIKLGAKNTKNYTTVRRGILDPETQQITGYRQGTNFLDKDGTSYLIWDDGEHEVKPKPAPKEYYIRSQEAR